MKTAFIFPGQGAQTPGMGKDVAEAYPTAAAIFEKANEIVGYDLRKLCIEGPEEKLNTTTISQPAIFTVSAAILEVVKEISGLKPDVTAGLSMGEYTALYAAGLMSFEDTLKLVQIRGQAMQAAADATEGSMVSIIGLDEQQIEKLCEEASQGEVLKGVNFNCQGQVVVSGTKGACDRAEKLAEKYGAMKAVRLAVAGAFHTSMMGSAADDLGKALEQCNISNPSAVKVLANINHSYYNNAEAIRDGLKKQLVSPILWQKSMEKLHAEGVEDFYEIGPNRVLTGLMKRINRKTKVTNISSAEALKNIKN